MKSKSKYAYTYTTAYKYVNSSYFNGISFLWRSACSLVYVGAYDDDVNDFKGSHVAVGCYDFAHCIMGNSSESRV